MLVEKVELEGGGGTVVAGDVGVDGGPGWRIRDGTPQRILEGGRAGSGILIVPPATAATTTARRQRGYSEPG